MLNISSLFSWTIKILSEDDLEERKRMNKWKKIHNNSLIIYFYLFYSQLIYYLWFSFHIKRENGNKWARCEEMWKRLTIIRYEFDDGAFKW